MVSILLILIYHHLNYFTFGFSFVCVYFAYFLSIFYVEKLPEDKNFVLFKTLVPRTVVIPRDSRNSAS